MFGVAAAGGGGLGAGLGGGLGGGGGGGNLRGYEPPNEAVSPPELRKAPTAVTDDIDDLSEEELL